MRHFATLLFVLALAPATLFAQSYSAILSGAAEIPGPGDTDGAGLAVVSIDGSTLRYTVWAQNIGAATSAHIHTGAAGVSGAPLVTLDHNMLSSGTVTVSADVANQIRSNPSGYYINVHTGEFPNGAIRGQLTSTAVSGGETSAYIPVVGKVKGANNTNFVTDLRIINNGAATANVTLDFYAQNVAGQAAPTVSKVVTIAPGEQKVLDDVAGVTLGVQSGLGGLALSSDQNVVASARVINDLREQSLGTAGFAIDAAAEGETAGTIAFLSNATDYRTNLGYFNPSAATVNVTLTARRALDGSVLGTTTIAVPAHAMVQQPVFSLISSVPEADRSQADFYVTWTASAPMFIYGAVTDNRTGDAVLNQ